MQARTRALWVFLLAAALAAGGAAQSENAEADPWQGRPRDAIVALLGEPTKARKSGAGEMLTYRFFRVDASAPPGPNVELLDVPGVGVVGRVVREEPGATGEVAIEPSGFDNKGRPTGNSVPTATQTGEASWSPGSGELDRSWQDRADAPRTRGKVTIKFRLDGDGHVVEWSLSPKKKPR